MSITREVIINPMGAVRQTRADAWKKRPVVVRYWQYKAELRRLLPEYTIPACGLSLQFHLKMPDSWSKKKRGEMNGKPHQQKPDIDNLVKGVLDALCEDDEYIWHLGSMAKFWAEEGKIIFKEEESV